MATASKRAAYVLIDMLAGLLTAFQKAPYWSSVDRSPAAVVVIVAPKRSVGVARFRVQHDHAIAHDAGVLVHVVKRLQCPSKHVRDVVLRQLHVSWRFGGGIAEDVVDVDTPRHHATVGGGRERALGWGERGGDHEGARGIEPQRMDGEREFVDGAYPHVRVVADEGLGKDLQLESIVVARLELEAALVVEPELLDPLGTRRDEPD